MGAAEKHPLVPGVAGGVGEEAQGAGLTPVFQTLPNVRGVLPRPRLTRLSAFMAHALLEISSWQVMYAKSFILRKVQLRSMA